jgi:hypothetical protein
MDETTLTLAAIVTAYVGVAKAYGVNPKHSPLIALAIAAALILVPVEMQDKALKISTIGLMASGFYHYTKKKKE